MHIPTKASTSKILDRAGCLQVQKVPQLKQVSTPRGEQICLLFNSVQLSRLTLNCSMTLVQFPTKASTSKIGLDRLGCQYRNNSKSVKTSRQTNVTSLQLQLSRMTLNCTKVKATRATSTQKKKQPELIAKPESPEHS